MLAGCEHSHSARYPPDPLLLSKKPVESRPAPGPLLALARHEPPAPEHLAVALTSADADVSPPEATTPRLAPEQPSSSHDGDADER
jgi:hypothetical protein